MNVLLISPRTPDTFWSFKHALKFVSRKSSHPPLGLLTVAGMLPASWTLELVDLDTSKLHDDQILRADYVMVSGMIVHRTSVEDIVDRCSALGKPIIAGGPLFASGRKSFPRIQHFVLGEAEDVIDQVARDMLAGCVAPSYRAGSFPDLSRTPIPRWDLIRFSDYACLSIQSSRGCPFNCEFCDIVAMNGRVPRIKPPQRVIAELESLRTAGWTGGVFIVDDNFIGNGQQAKRLLRAMIEWRERTQPRMEFLAEASVNLGDDPELLQLMAAVGFKKVFLGIETPSLEGLRECGKKQNLQRDLVESVRSIQAAGIEVMGGFILGFDSDTPDIFERQFDFIQKAGIVTAMVGLLTALPDTRLYRRLASEGRLLAPSGGNNTEATCNFLPALGRDTLVDGYRRLMRSLYEPGALYARARGLLAHHKPQGPRLRPDFRDVRALLRSVWELGIRCRGRREYWKFLGHTLAHRPRAFALAVSLTIYGHHFRILAESL